MERKAIGLMRVLGSSSNVDLSIDGLINILDNGIVSSNQGQTAP